jgi:hypothetical protein
VAWRGGAFDRWPLTHTRARAAHQCTHARAGAPARGTHSFRVIASVGPTRISLAPASAHSPACPCVLPGRRLPPPSPSPKLQTRKANSIRTLLSYSRRAEEALLLPPPCAGWDDGTTRLACPIQHKNARHLRTWPLGSLRSFDEVSRAESIFTGRYKRTGAGALFRKCSAGRSSSSPACSAPEQRGGTCWTLILRSQWQDDSAISIIHRTRAARSILRVRVRPRSGRVHVYPVM